MQRNLFVFAESRSGSNWLVETLNGHPSIGMLKEIFQYNQRNRYNEQLNRSPEPFRVGMDVEYLKQRLGDLEKEWSGCKILFPQIRFFDFYDFIENFRDASFIVLSRENAVKAEISGCIAKTRGRWHERAKTPDREPIHIDPVCFLRRLQWRRLTRELVTGMLEAYRVKRIYLSYEDLFRDNGAVLDKTWDFLGVPPGNVKYSNEKPSNPHPARALVKNYGQLREYLEPYPEYLAMLEKDQP